MLGTHSTGRSTNSPYASQPDVDAMLGARRASLASLPPALERAAHQCFRLRQPGKDAPDAAASDAIRPGAPKLTLDRLGRKIREEDALGRVRTWSYDACGNLVAETDRDGRQSTREITSWNLVGARANALGHAIRYEYTRFGNYPLLTGITWVHNAQGVGRYTAVLAYESRDDHISDCHPGFDLILDQRLKEVRVLSAGSVVSRYVLTYEDMTVSTGNTRLQRVERFAGDGTRDPVVFSFEYSQALGTECTGSACQRPFSERPPRRRRSSAAGRAPDGDCRRAAPPGRCSAARRASRDPTPGRSWARAGRSAARPDRA